MPLTPSFSSSQIIGQPSSIVLTDTSTGSDVAVVKRRVYLVNYLGENVVPSGTTTSYIDWNILDSSITIDCLTEDSALNVTVQWLNVSNVVLYSATDLKGYTLYNETFYYSLTQAQSAASNPSNIIQDTVYYTNKMKLRVLIDSGNQAITLGDDIASAQQCYNGATYLTNNQDLFF